MSTGSNKKKKWQISFPFFFFSGHHYPSNQKYVVKIQKLNLNIKKFFFFINNNEIEKKIEKLYLFALSVLLSPPPPQKKKKNTDKRTTNIKT